MAARKIGQRNPAVGVKPGKTVKETMRDLLKFVRTDFGGPNSTTQIQRRLTDSGIPVTPDTIAAYRVGAKYTRNTIKQYQTPQVRHLRNLIG